MRLSLDRPHALKYPDEAILAELHRVAKIYNHRKFTGREFDLVASYCKCSVVKSRFGSWEEALAKVGAVHAPKKKDRSYISNTALFEEMARVWQAVGHRPSQVEWDAHNPAYSYTTYKTRFQGWLNACADFIEYASERADIIQNVNPISAKESSKSVALPKPKREDRRDVPAKLRVRLYVRDNFCCRFCGNSPAINRGVILHIDHIVPYARGGKTVEENLRVLCQQCNLGKGVEQIES